MPDMRFAPPPAIRVPDRGGGLNQVSVRTYNERLVMSLLRQRGGASRMELGQLSGLSAQTISVIVRSLERDSLILAGEAQRGRVGPPSIPMSLNPDGAFAIGVKIGIRSRDMVLIDFLGRVRDHREMNYDHPDPADVVEAIGHGIAALSSSLPPEWRGRLVGVGICVPHDFEDWPRPGWGAVQWRGLDLESVSRDALDVPTFIQNDVTAASSAEVIFGAARRLDDFAYFFIDSELSSRLVLNHRIYAGRHDAVIRAGTPTLLDLERLLVAEGRDPDAIWHAPDDWPDYGVAEERWIAALADGLAQSIRSVLALVDLGTVLVAGRFPARVQDALCARLGATFAETAGSGTPLSILPGTMGSLSKAVGAAGMVFHSRFMVEEVGLATA